MASTTIVLPGRTSSARLVGGYEFAVIVPTFNEAANVRRTIDAVDAALAGIRFEIIFVDDWSPDGTADEVARIAQGRSDIRVIRRLARNGLASAVIEGMMATMAPVVAVIDGDGQHDERLLPHLFSLVSGGLADVAIGSRYCQRGSTGDWSSVRLRCSRAATGLSRLVLQSPVADPMSGFFAVRRNKVETLLPRLSGRGFKLLFDLLTSSPEPLRTIELPFEFRARVAGTSKVGASVVLDYLVTIGDRLIRRFAPPRPVMFAVVGSLGLGVHLTVLRGMMAIGQSNFETAQVAAVLCAIAFNFLVNNSFTFRDRRLKGFRLLGGLSTFYLLCGVGALANVGTGVMLFTDHQRWWVSGAAGAIVGSAWNFAASMLVTWRRR